MIFKVDWHKPTFPLIYLFIIFFKYSDFQSEEIPEQGEPPAKSFSDECSTTTGTNLLIWSKLIFKVDWHKPTFPLIHLFIIFFNYLDFQSEEIPERVVLSSSATEVLPDLQLSIVN